MDLSEVITESLGGISDIKFSTIVTGSCDLEIFRGSPKTTRGLSHEWTDISWDLICENFRPQHVNGCPHMGVDLCIKSGLILRQSYTIN